MLSQALFNSSSSICNVKGTQQILNLAQNHTHDNFIDKNMQSSGLELRTALDHDEVAVAGMSLDDTVTRRII